MGVESIFGWRRGRERGMEERKGGREGGRMPKQERRKKKKDMRCKRKNRESEPELGQTPVGERRRRRHPHTLPACQPKHWIPPAAFSPLFFLSLSLSFSLSRSRLRRPFSPSRPHLHCSGRPPFSPPSSPSLGRGRIVSDCKSRQHRRRT